MLEVMQVSLAPWSEFLVSFDDPRALQVNQSLPSEREPPKTKKKQQPHQEGPDADNKKIELYEVDHAASD